MRIFWTCLDKWGGWVYRPETMTRRWLDGRGTEAKQDNNLRGVAALRGGIEPNSHMTRNFSQKSDFSFIRAH